MVSKNLDSELHTAIRSVMNELGPRQFYHPQQITDALEVRKFWSPGSATTPNQTITSYLSQNSEHYTHTGDGRYMLHHRYYETPQQESIGAKQSTLVGWDTDGISKVLEIRADCSATGEEWAVLKLHVKGNPFTITVPADRLREAMLKLHEP